MTKKSCTATLRALPIGEERVISSTDFSYKTIYRRAALLKKSGYDFKISSPRGIADTYITRLQ